MCVCGLISGDAATAVPAGRSCASLIALFGSSAPCQSAAASSGWFCRGTVSTVDAAGARRVNRSPPRTPGRDISKAFGRFAVGLCTIAPIKSVANWLGVGWDLVKALFKADLRKRLRRRRLGALRYIAIVARTPADTSIALPRRCKSTATACSPTSAIQFPPDR